MKNRQLFWATTALLFVIPIISAGLKLSNKPTSLSDLLPKEVFTVIYEFDLSNLPHSAFVKAFLPAPNERQQITDMTSGKEGVTFRKDDHKSGVQGRWETTGQDDVVFNYQFEVEGKSVQYIIPPDAPLETAFDDTIAAYLGPTEHIQSDHHLIDSIGQALERNTLKQTLQANFDFVQAFTNSETGVLTDALTALKRNRASCNGKSRLFVALCRAQGIPSRVAGGIIMENARKRTSHLWAEVFYRGNWLPFDVLNQHFAFLPAHYLELYKGDQFLLTHSKDIGFDYQFIIHKQYQTQSILENSKGHLWALPSISNIPFDLLRGLLLLPLAALIIAIFRNVVGLKTFGIFLPVLIGLALSRISLAAGLVTFGTVILIVSLLHLVLEKWGLLHVPKVVIMMTTVVVTLLGLGYIGTLFHVQLLNLALFFPVVVLSITAERFAKTLVEEQLADALKMLGTTFLIALICIPLFQSELLMGIFLTYPELYLAILGTMLMLGRWIGMRVSEYHRFAALSIYSHPNQDLGELGNAIFSAHKAKNAGNAAL